MTDLLKKGVPFNWTKECTDSLTTLLDIIESDPVLNRPNYDKPFEIEVDASQYAAGSMIFQHDDKQCPLVVGFHSKTFSPAERGYDIHDRELLGYIWALKRWRHILLSSPFPTKVYTDHANLQHYKEPQRSDRRAARYLTTMADYNVQLIHKPGKTNRADRLSRPPGTDQGQFDNEKVVVLPPALFVNAADTTTLEDEVVELQNTLGMFTLNWQKDYPEIKHREGLLYHQDRLVVPPHDKPYKKLLQQYHDHPIAGHPGISNTYKALSRDFWWPEIRTYVTNYVKGYATCQSTKPNMTKPKTPLQPIPTDQKANPFQHISMDLITDLPNSDGFDSILTIVDHDCSKAAVFLPCNKTITAEGVAKLYGEKMLPFFGIPESVISDRDPRFTSKFATALCKNLGIGQHMTTAYHPQSDGQSEQANQRVELYLRIYRNEQETDWARLLPMAQFVHNLWPNATTGKAPFELLYGHVPSIHVTSKSETPAANDRATRLDQLREQAQNAIRNAQRLLIRRRERGKGQRHYHPHQKDDRVWLEGTNLKLSHPSSKLAPKRFVPFKITEVLSPVTFRVSLPPQWKIHNVFHASLLTPYKETEEHGVNFPQPPPDIIDGEEEYEVEKIIDVRRRGRKLQFLLRWKGYSPAEDTWENEEDIHAPELLENFYLGDPVRTSIKTIEVDNESPFSFLIDPQYFPISSSMTDASIATTLP